MNDQYEELAKNIIKYVGGIDNIDKLTHCMTRLRFIIKDYSLVQYDALNKLEGVSGALNSNGIVHVVIGLKVKQVYDAINKILEPNQNDKQDKKRIKKTPLQQFISIMTDIYVPYFGVIAACGILSGVLSLLVSFHVLDGNGSTYNVLYCLANGFFYYLPILLAYTASKRFSFPVIEGLIIGAGLLHPNLLSSSTVAHDTLFGIGIMMPPSGDYSSSAIPIMIAIAFASWFEKKYAKYIPDIIKGFAVPLITCTTTFILTLFVIGPVTNNLTYSLSYLLKCLEDLNQVIYGGLLGAIWPLVLITGLHYAVLPIVMNNLAVLGYDTTLSSTFGFNFVCIGTLLAIRVKSKDKELKKKCFPSILSSGFGIVEPALYGVILRKRKTLVTTCLASGVIGIGMTLTGVHAFRFVGFGIFGYAAYTNLMSVDHSCMYWAFIWSLLAIVLGFVITYFSYNEDKEIKE